MIPATISIKSLHLEYRLWIHELNFCKEEISIFENHLQLLTSRNTVNGFMAQAEHFQNQFIVQKEAIDKLKHDLAVTEKHLAAFAHEVSDIGFESIRMDNHAKLRDQVHTFREIYSGLKHDFRRFESQWM